MNMDKKKTVDNPDFEITGETLDELSNGKEDDEE